MKYILVCVITTLAVSTGGSAGASEKTDASSRFMPYETSYITVQQAEGDEGALHAKYSFKYCLANYYSNSDYSASHSNGAASSCKFSGTVDSSLYFSYTGEFDFYARTRPSDPVINRLSNPALHMQFSHNYWRWLENHLDWIDIAFEHRSNGQVTEVSSVQEAAKAQLAYNANDHTYFDSISRGANYFSIAGMIKSADEKTRYSAKAKKYVTQTSDITWGSLAGTNTTISDYDRMQIFIQHRINSVSEFSIEWTIGDRGLHTDSFNIDLLPNRDWPFPLYFRYHNGPMHTLSNYTENQSYLGVGFEFIP